MRMISVIIIYKNIIKRGGSSFGGFIISRWFITLSRQGIFVVLLFLLISCILLIIPLDDLSPVGHVEAAQPLPVEGAITYWDGEWDVDSNAVYRNQTIIVNGNLTVFGGFSLILINVTIRMNNTGNMSTYIHVNNGGNLIISDYDNDPLTTEDGCNITSNITDGDHRFGFYVHQGSSFTMTNSALSDVGHGNGSIYERGLYIHTDNVIIRNSTVSRSYRGITVDASSGIIIENCTLNNLDDDGIFAQSTSDSLFYNNSIELSGISDLGIGLTMGSWRNKIINNTINVTGGNCEGIRVSGGGAWNEIHQNTLYVNGSGAEGILLYSGYVNITSNTVYLWDPASDGIQLSGGSFTRIIDNTVVASGINVAGIELSSPDNITLKNNNITVSQNNCRGIDIGFSAHDILIENTTITVTSGINNYGINIDNSYNITVINTTITGPETDLDLSFDSHIVVINTSFSTYDIFDALSDLTVQYFLDLTIEDWKGQPVSSALVRIKNTTDSTVFSDLSDSNGQITLLPVTEVVYYLGSSVFETPHNITVTASGLDPWNTLTTMDQNRHITATLQPFGITTAQRRGDWWIDTTEEYWNTTFLMDGNITINATGNLILNNCTIMFNATAFNSQYYLNVTWGGELHVYDTDWDNYTTNDASVITDSPFDTDDGGPLDFAFSFYAWGGSVLEIRNSHVIDCGWESPSIHDEGIYVETNSAVFNHAYIQGNFIGINFGGSANSIVKNSTIIINEYWNFSSAIRAWNCPNLQILYNNFDISTTSNDDLGIYVGYSLGTIILGNRLTVSGSQGFNYGMFLINSSNYIVNNNTVIFDAPGIAMNFDLMDNCFVSGNDIILSVNWGTGISIFDVTNSRFDRITVLLTDSGGAVYLAGIADNTIINDLTITSTTASVDGVYIEGGQGATFTNIVIDLQGVGSYGFTLNNADNITIRNLILNVTNTWGGGLTFEGGTRNCGVDSAQVTTGGFITALLGNNCSNIWVVNSTLNSPTAFDVEVIQNSTVILVNPTFSDYDVTEPLSGLIVMWFLNVQVIDEFGQPFSGVNVRLEMADTTEVRTSLVNSNGWLNWTVCIGYVATESGVFNTTNPHLIRAYNATCWDETQIDMSYQNQVVILALVNEDPVISDPVFNIQVQEDSFYIRTFHATDFEGNSMSWSINTSLSWIQIDSISGVLTITPTNDNVGVYDFTIRVTDVNGGYDEFTTTVEIINQAPVIQTTNILVTLEDLLYYRDYDSDDDPDTYWAIELGPLWLSIDNNTGELSGTPDNSETGFVQINISVEDEFGGKTYNRYTLWVINTRPQITTGDVPTTNEDEGYWVDYNSTDDGQGNVTWSLVTNTSWLSINSTTGVLSGTPTNLDIGSWFVNVTVNDGNWGEAYSNFTITVINTPPSITVNDNQWAEEDTLYSVNYASSDDGLGNISWNLDTDATWLSINTSTGVLSGTPSNLDVGSWDVTVTCFDGNGGTNRHTFIVNVANVNDAPQISYFLPSDMYPSVEEGISLDFNISYTDEDSSTFSIIWTLDGEIVRQDVPFWSYQPPFGTAGDHEVIVNVTDNAGASVQKDWIVIVTRANRAPIIDNYGPMNLKPILGSDESKLTFSVNASDPDSDSLTYQWFIDGNDTGVRTPTFTLDRSQYGEGTYNLEVRVIDENDTVTSLDWEITVKPEKKEEPGLFNLFLILAIVIAVVVTLLVVYLWKKGQTSIEDIFIVSNSGMLLAHRSKEIRPDMDDDVLSSMLTAVQDFIKDSFKGKSKTGLKRLDFGESVIHIKRGKYIYMAVILSGKEPADLDESLGKQVSKLEAKYAEVLEEWDGDMNVLRGMKDMLDDLIK